MPGAATAIRRHSFANDTVILEDGTAVTLHGGAATASNSDGLKRVVLGRDDIPTGIPPIVYGDVNHDGIEDAVVTFSSEYDNNVLEQYSVWVGTPQGGVKLLGKPFISQDRCGKSITTIRIGSDGIIRASGNGPGTSCAGQGTGPRYTSTYRVVGSAVQTLVAPPADW